MVRTNSKAQYEDYELCLKATHDKMRAIITEITPVLNFIDRNLAPSPMGDLNISPHPLDPSVERCKGALTNFRAYVHNIVCTAVGHALAVVRSLYPVVSLEVNDGGFPEVTNDAEVEQLMEGAMESALRLVEDLDIFSEREQNQQN